MTTLDQAEVHKLQQEFRAHFAAFAPALIDAATDLLQRISGPNFVAMEWSMAKYAALYTGLSNDQSWELVLSNVIGLAFVRVTDDIADSQVQSSKDNDAVLLSAALHHLWVERYEKLLSGAGDTGEQRVVFWRYYGQIMSQWLCSTAKRNQLFRRPFHLFSEDDFLELADRGCPLKLCCILACLLTGNADRVGPICRALDYMMVGCVLLDHLEDWQEDLAAHRDNLFISYCTDAPQTENFNRINRLSVLRESYVGKGVSGYFSKVHWALKQAKECAITAHFDDFCTFISVFQSDVRRFELDRLLDAEQRVIRASEELSLMHSRALSN